jgi:hypothetical protein
MKTPKIHPGDLVAKAGVAYDFTEITGNLDCSEADAKTTFDKLTTIGGNAYLEGWTGSAPKLTTIGGSADFQGWAGSAPKLTTIGGSAYFQGWTGSAPNLTTIGGHAYFQGWTGSAPKLTTIGGHADFQGWAGSTDKIKTNAGETAKTICSDSQKAALASVGLVRVDGILAKLVSKRGGVMRVVIIGQTKQSYIVEREGKAAHGATLAEARADLLVKIGNRDTTPYKKWTLKTSASLEEMIVAYRAITGACKNGVLHFLSGTNMPAKFTVAFAIEKTVGKYGHEQFKSFFSK